MQTIKNLLSTVILGSLTGVLFLMGLAIAIVMTIFLIVIGLLTGAKTRHTWKKQWQTQQHRYQSPFNRHPEADTQQAHRVIEGEYTVTKN